MTRTSTTVPPPSDPQPAGTAAAHPQTIPAVARARSALSFRSILIGMLLVAFIAVVAPYNDDLLANSSLHLGNARLIGNHFPIGIFTLMAFLMVVINPLLAVFKRRPLARGELIVIMTMLLISAAAPSSGLMRYLEPMIIAPAHAAGINPWFKPFYDLLPRALFPAPAATSQDLSPLISNFENGIDPATGAKIPILPFLLPQLLWAILIAAIMGAAFFLAAIFRKQWVHHERLTYPLATIPLELMAPPQPGKFYNDLWRNGLLWAGAAIPLFVYLLKGLHAHFPAFPDIALQFRVSDSFTDRPWDATPLYITQAQVYFAAIGICFFIPSEIAFSMWFFLVLNACAYVFFARTSFQPADGENTRSMGVYFAYFAGLLWLARGHLKLVLTSAWKKLPRATDEPISYRAMVLGFMICIVVALAWLVAVGMNPIMALLLLAVGMMLVTLMARIVAETGLFFVGPIFWGNTVFQTLLTPAVLSKTSMLWAQITSRLFFADLRETLMPYAANALRMGQSISASPADEAADARRPYAGGQGAKWIKWLLLALLLSIILSGGVHHYLDYTYGRTAINDGHASTDVPEGALKDTYAFYSSPRYTSLGESWTQAGTGAVLAVGLMAGRMMWAGWPFHPIGLVLMNCGPMRAMWFSIFLGWVIKKLLLRYGGAPAFRRARPFFIGLIVGETLAAGVWMFLGLATNGAVHYSFLPN